MHIIRHYTGVPKAAQGAVVAIGNFDGVHLGHQRVIGEAGRIAMDLAAPHGVLTFEPHPRRFFRPEEPKFELTPLQSKVRHMGAAGVDVLFVMPFDREFSEKTAEQFVAELLVDGIKARHLVVGYDFVFGNRRCGNIELLQRLAADAGIGVMVVEAVQDGDGRLYSSSVIRNYLAEGKPGPAAKLLGRCWEIEGRVQVGDRRGREIGFPTANVDPAEYLEPALGVYAVWAGIETGSETVWHQAVANIGRRPTFGGDGIVVEVYIFDFAGDLYGRVLRVALVEFLRPEMKFDGVAAIRDQIARDCAQARSIIDAIPEGDFRGPPRPAPATAA